MQFADRVLTRIAPWEDELKLARRVIDEAVKSFQTSNRDRMILWDDEIAGFGCRITRKGATYFLNYRSGPSERRLTLGTTAELTIEQARRKAAETKLQVRAGADPLAEKRAAIAAREAKGMTMAQLAARFLDDGESRWRPRTHSDYKYTLESHVLPEIGKLVAAEVSKARIAEVIAGVRKRSPAMAAKTLRVVGSMMRWAEDAEILDEARLPRTKTTAPSVAARTRLPTDQEIAQVWAAADQLIASEAAFARLIILTALRSGAVEHVTRSWMREGVIHLPAAVMKGKRDHQVPISSWAMPYVAATLDEPQRGKTVSAGTRRKAMRILQDLRKLTGIADITFHDMRRAFRTWCARNGIAKDHAEVALAHISFQSALDKAYDQHTYREEAGKALLAWQEHVRKIVQG